MKPKENQMNAVNQALHTTGEENAPQAVASQTVFTPKADIVEREKEYLLFIEIPGVKKEDVSLQIVKNTLTITGKLQPTEHGKEIRQEYREGNYQRDFRLSSEVDQSEITAKLENGTLEVQLPKKPEALPVNITVQ